MEAVGQMTDFMSNEMLSQVSRIVGTVGQRLMGFIRARVSNETDAEDILQDVWQRLVTTLEDRPVEDVAAWLYTVARNRIVDHYRKPRMASLDALADETELEDVSFEIPEYLLHEASTPESENLRNLFWDQLQVALAELPQEQRQVFVWHELEGLSFQDIGELTGEKLNTLLSRKRYAVLHLRKRFQRLRDEFLT